MNHIYKVIWNKAKHCYIVVSEIAKSHSDSTKRVRVGTTVALMAVAVLTGFAMPAQAAVSIGTDGTVKAEAADINALNNLLKNGVTTNKDGSVTVGGLTVKKNGEVSVNNSPDVVYGKNAKITWDSNNTMGQISIGNNATVVTGHGGQEKAFAYDGDFNHAAGAIAIGTNTYARTGSIMIGSHVYKGDMGDVKNIDTDSFNTDTMGLMDLL
ncbi:ESPR domain-containing protein [Allisonella histaminiformans]|uniref:ESPR domain-containing protein n=1 Tax=Allisonella histaminiformans TaxID=209880 RepID=UPI002E7A915A|nr:ESPR domain-containing protein [Allisonella histaminiformans]